MGGVFPALKNARKAVCFIKDGSAAIADLDEATAKLQLMFSLSLFASFIVSGIMS